ncbi:MAG: hypothetical protein K6347_05560 [Campylobacterales bacterium]
MAEHYRRYREELQEQQERLRHKARQLAHTIANVLNDASQWHFNAEPLLENYPEIEALYLIDTCAKQVGPTLMRAPARTFYEPSSEGCDHSLKEYYIGARHALDGCHLTRRYLSLASGNLCHTYTSPISLNGQFYLLCIDLIQ